MKRPPWLSPLNQRDERTRAALGLIPKKDGWYKSIDGRTRYLFKPMPVADVAPLVEARVREIRARDAGTPAAGLPVRVTAGGLSLEGLVELYLTWLLGRVRTGSPKKLARRTYDDNVIVLSAFVEIVGPGKAAATLGPDDFSRFVQRRLAGRAASTRRREIIYVEALFNWAGPGRKRMNLIPALNYGPDWRKPTDDEIATSAADSDKAYTVEQARVAMTRVRNSPMLRAAGYLGLNCAFGPRDVALLPEAAVDLDGETIRFARGKTGVGRLAALWPETVAALRGYLDQRPAACDPSAVGLFFRTRNGLPYARDEVDEDAPDDAGEDYNSVGSQWSKMTGLPHSGLRSTFATWADSWVDQRAVDIVMGHRSNETVRRKHYAKRFDHDRVRRLAEYIRQKLIGVEGGTIHEVPSSSP